MEGRNHEIAVTELLEFHLITKESSWYRCECCEVKTTDYLEHINSRSHTITFLQKYEIDKKEMRKYVYESDVSDVVARCHRVRYKNLLKHNGIYKLNDTSYYCGMCQIKLGRISELYHVLGERHALKLAEIEEYHKFLTYTDDTEVHCEICYVNIPQVDRNIIIEHMEGRNHEIAVTELLEFHLITKESSWYLCECCEVQTTDYLEHINSRSHTITFLQKYEIDKSEMREYVYESDVNDVVAHLHRVRYRNLLKHNGIYKLNETSYYCGMCQIKLGRICELDHVLGERHALKLAEIEEYYTFLTYTDDTQVNCEICYVNIPKVDRNIIDHMEGRNHEIAVTELLELHLITKEPSLYLCECCEVQTTDYLEHINSRSHTITFLQKYEIDKKDMRKYVYESDVDDVVAHLHRVRYRNLLKHNGIYKLNDTSYYCGMCQIKLGRICELYHVLGERHALKLAEIEEYHEFLTYTDDTEVHCEICYVNIPQVDRNVIIEHMEGSYHEIAVTELLKFHLITKESSCYLCECCEVQTTNYLEHINSRSHTITFLQEYEIDKSEMRKYVYESDVNDVVAHLHRVRYRNLLKHNGIYKLNETSYYCGMCQIKLGRICELDHVLGERHALKLAEIENL